MENYCLEDFIRENIPPGSTRVALSTAKKDWHFMIDEDKGITLDVITEPDSKAILSVKAQVKRCPADGLISPEEIEILAKEYGGDYGISVLGTSIFRGRYNPISPGEEISERWRYPNRDAYIPLFKLLGIEYSLTDDKLIIAREQPSLLLTPERVKEAYALLCEKKVDNPLNSLYNCSEDSHFAVRGSRDETRRYWTDELDFEVGEWPYRQGPLTSEKIKSMERTIQRHGWTFQRMKAPTFREQLMDLWSKKATPTVPEQVIPFRKKIVYTENDYDGGFP